MGSETRDCLISIAWVKIVTVEHHDQRVVILRSKNDKMIAFYFNTTSDGEKGRACHDRL